MAPNRRSSPDVVQKRRVARQFNDLLRGGGTTTAALDGRTEKRRQRIVEELREGVARATGASLKPIDVLTRVATLLELGMTAAAIRKVCKVPRKVQVTDEVVAGIKALHLAYGFPMEAYAFVGLDDDTLRKAGVLGASKARFVKASNDDSPPPSQPKGSVQKAKRPRRRPGASRSAA